MSDQKESNFLKKTSNTALQIDNEESRIIDDKPKPGGKISLDSKSNQDDGIDSKETSTNIVDTEQSPEEPGKIGDNKENLEDKVSTKIKPEQKSVTNKEFGKIDDNKENPEDKVSTKVKLEQKVDDTVQKPENKVFTNIKPGEEGITDKEFDKIDGEVKPENKICIDNNFRTEDRQPLPLKYNNEESGESSDTHSLENKMWIDNEESGERNNTVLPEDETSTNNTFDSEDGLPATTFCEKDTDEMWLCNVRTLSKAVNNRKRYQNQKVVLDENEQYSLKKIKIEDTRDDQFNELWKYLQQDFSNFNEWVNILHMVDNHNIDVNARMAYSKFLEIYPLCYGYWKKYANFEKRNNNIHEFEKVLENGLSAIPISVDLWIYYMTYLRTERSNEDHYIRNEFERSLKMCGLDYRSDQLWHDYISWEVEKNKIFNAVNIYYRFIRIPTINYLKNFFKFQEFIFKKLPEKYLGLAEFLKRRSMIIKAFGTNHNIESLAGGSMPPGEDFPQKTEITENRIMSILRLEVIESWYYFHKETAREFENRRIFEENIRRTHFHVNELESSQIKNWENYIKFERRAGNHERIIFLYERCLITCVSNQGFWLNYLEYLSFVNLDVTALLTDVFKRSLFHHPKSLLLNLKYFDFSETQGLIETAVETITQLEIFHPNSKEVAIRIMNLARRKKDGTLEILYKHHLNCSQSKSFSSYIAVKYARFVWKHDQQLNLAFDIINNAIRSNNINVNDSLEIYLTFVELKMELNPKDQLSVLKTIDEIISQCNLYKEKLVFSKKKLEYAEDYIQDYDVLRLAKIEYKHLKNICFREKRQSL